ncbi:MAG: hypothetical protein K8S98_19025 [Planctomycetes bacterium]|nr:hypothetical protein [Planctomycetota bacterium]
MKLVPVLIVLGSVASQASAQFVQLQPASPGTTETGNVNVSGRIQAGEFASSASSTGPLLNLLQNSSGNVAQFVGASASSSSDALYVENAGAGAALRVSVKGATTGRGLYLTNQSGKNTSPLLQSANYGLGKAGMFETYDTSNTSAALSSWHGGLGSAAYFWTSLDANTSPTVDVYQTANGQGLRVKKSNPSSSGSAATISGNQKASTLYVEQTTGGAAGYFFSNTVANAQVLTAIAGTGIGDAFRAIDYGGGWAMQAFGLESGATKSNGVYISSPTGTTGLSVGGGTKSAVVATSQGARLLYCEEATEVWFTDYGSGQVQNGVTAVAIDPLFAETVDLNQPYLVFVQAESAQCRGLAVENKRADSFEVVELDGGSSNAPFGYRIVAKRRGYASERMRHLPEADQDPNLYPKAAEARETTVGAGLGH